VVSPTSFCGAAALLILALTSSSAQRRPSSWLVGPAFRVAGGIAGEWRHCVSCTGVMSEPLPGSGIAVFGGLRFGSHWQVGAEAYRWRHISYAIANSPPGIQSEYVLAAVAYELSPRDPFVFSAGIGRGWHRSKYGNEGHGPVGKVGVSWKLLEWSHVAFGVETDLLHSFAGEHAENAGYALPAGRYRPDPLLILLNAQLR
jgi:hypothetical protein